MAVEWPTHPVGSKRWTYIPAPKCTEDGAWELCVVLDVYGEVGGRFGDYPELYDVLRANGKTSRGHFASSLRDQAPGFVSAVVERGQQTKEG